ncbi:MAG: shikimate dehydrogenase [Spirochaetes bacterium RBG_16_49_21]|nr:MAG: shikimate dehydrogenase [Spirochaetes bacterium RBG_16_49_21]
MKQFEIDSQTKLYCIFGSPVRHTLSPVMHNAAFRKIGANAVFLAFEPPSIRAAVASMRSLDIKGAAITIPFKIDVLECLDAVDPRAADIGSVNTLVNTGGLITGYNTDGSGAVQALAAKKINAADSNTLVLGNGGSARAIAFALLQSGAAVIVAGRNAPRVERLVRDLEKQYTQVRGLLISDLDRKLMEGVDIIINATPVGMAPDTGSMPISDELLVKRHAVFDIVYSPRMTKLLAAAAEKGCAIINGIDMLIYQGLQQFELWTGKEAPFGAVKSAISGRLREKHDTGKA